MENRKIVPLTTDDCVKCGKGILDRSHHIFQYNPPDQPTIRYSGLCCFACGKDYSEDWLKETFEQRILNSGDDIRRLG